MLELSFEFKLCECIDVFANIYMVAVCNVAFIRYTLDDSETLLQTLRKFICRGFKRCAVEREIDIVFFLPSAACGIHFFHDAESKRSCRGVGMTLSRHILHAFVKTGIPE